MDLIPLFPVSPYVTDQADGLPPLISFDYQSFQGEVNRTHVTNSYTITGDVIVTNTLEDFRRRDKQDLLDSLALKVRVLFCSLFSVFFPDS